MMSGCQSKGLLAYTSLSDYHRLLQRSYLVIPGSGLALLGSIKDKETIRIVLLAAHALVHFPLWCHMNDALDVHPPVVVIVQ